MKKQEHHAAPLIAEALEARADDPSLASAPVAAFTAPSYVDDLHVPYPRASMRQSSVSRPAMTLAGTATI
jgi:hypothetical protein